MLMNNNVEKQKTTIEKQKTLPEKNPVVDQIHNHQNGLVEVKICSSLLPPTKKNTN